MERRVAQALAAHRAARQLGLFEAAEPAAPVEALRQTRKRLGTEQTHAKLDELWEQAATAKRAAEDAAKQIPFSGLTLRQSAAEVERARASAQKARRAARKAAGYAARWPTDDAVQSALRSVVNQAEKAGEAASYAADKWRARWPGARLGDARGRIG